MKLFKKQTSPQRQEQLDYTIGCPHGRYSRLETYNTLERMRIDGNFPDRDTLIKEMIKKVLE